ncbi:MAG: transcriptional activator NhaR [Methylohalobius sp.]
MSEFNYKHLYYFWTVVQEGSLTKASQRLYLTPQTICAQLKMLESRLGARLFRRRGRSLVLTDVGQTVWRYADEIFALGRELADAVERQALAEQRQLAVGLTDFLPKLIVYRLLEPIFTWPDGCKVRCHEGKLESLLAELASHKLDLVLSDQPLPQDAPVRVCERLLGTSGISFFAAPELAKRLLGFPQGLDGAPMVGLAQGAALREQLEQWFKEEKIRPQIVAEFEDSALLKVFGQKGVGVFCAPTLIEAEVIDHYRVQVIGRSDAVKMHFFAIFHQRRADHPAICRLLG